MSLSLQMRLIKDVAEQSYSGWRWEIGLDRLCRRCLDAFNGTADAARSTLAWSSFIKHITTA
jgi:hypothetical protein